MSALTDLFSALATKIRSKTGGSDTYTPPQMVSAIDDVYDAGVAAGTTPTQTKTVTAGTSATTVTPDTGYALSSVTVNPTPSQSKSATPTTSSQTITPDSGKLLSSVSVGAIQTETKSDTPNVSTNKTVSPSSGKYLSQVTIQPLTHSGTYTPAANTAQNDMGAYHDKRYVNTSGMIVPSGAKSITANGTGIDVSSYATANVNVPNPTLSGNATAADVANGKTFYNSTYTKQTGSYVAPTINNITPSNSSPMSMSANNNYKPSANGYAISSYTSISTAELDSGVYFSSGIKKMASSGYAYSSKAYKYGWDSETQLWYNTSPTTNIGSFDATLSQSYANFNYIKIVYAADSAASSSRMSVIYSKDDFAALSTAKGAFRGAASMRSSGSSGNIFDRHCYPKSTTVVNFGQPAQAGGSSTANGAVIPLYIYGLK